MNSSERVNAAVGGRPADRRAVSLTLSLYGAGLTKCPLEQYYRDPLAYSRGQSAVYAAVRPDLLFGPFAFALLGEAFGSRVHFMKDQAPNLVGPVLGDAGADSVSRLEIPDITSHPNLLYLQRALQLMAAEFGPEVPVATAMLSPIDLPIMLMGIGGWLDTVLFDPDGVKRILAITQPFFVEMANALLAAGSAFVVLPAMFANPSIVTREIIAATAIPVLRESFAQVNGPMVIQSGGVRIGPFLDLFADLPNVTAAVVNDGEDLAEARRAAGPELTLIGNLEGPALIHRTPEEIQADCLRVLRECQADPYFILGSTGVDIAIDTPVENLLAWKRAVEIAAN